MRRILRKIAAGEEDSIGDTSTLADPSVRQGNELLSCHEKSDDQYGHNVYQNTTQIYS